MAYDEKIDERVREVVSRWDNSGSRKMFGGVCHMLNGNMICGVLDDFLILRLGEKRANEALRYPHVRPFDVTGRPMKGWVMVEKAGFTSDEELKSWLMKAKEFVKNLPPK
jgi:TfoX/Sxy family transcriptional regulator of competence genes